MVKIFRDAKGFILSRIHINITERRVRRTRREKWQQTRQRYDKSPTSKIYTTLARILSDRNIFCTLRGGRTTAGSNAPGAFFVNRQSPWRPPVYKLGRGVFMVTWFSLVRSCLGQQSPSTDR